MPLEQPEYRAGILWLPRRPGQESKYHGRSTLPNLFIFSPPELPSDNYCQGITLSTYSEKATSFTGYVNGKKDAKVEWQFHAIHRNDPVPTNSEYEVELIAFRIFQYSLSGEVEKVTKNCLITPTVDQNISLVKVVLNVIPQSIFYMAAFQYDIWHSGYLDVEFDGFMGHFNREYGIAAKKRAFKVEDPVLFCIESNPEMCGIAILESEISESKWEASLYLVDVDISQLDRKRLVSMKTGHFEREKSEENVRNSFETDFATVEEIKSHLSL